MNHPQNWTAKRCQVRSNVIPQGHGRLGGREVGEMRVVGTASAGGSLLGSKRLHWGKVKVLARWDGQLLTPEYNCHRVAFHCSCIGHDMNAKYCTF